MTTLADRIERALDAAYDFCSLTEVVTDARLALAEWREREVRLAGQEPVGEIESSPFGLIPAMYPDNGLRSGAKLYAAPIPERARVSDEDLRWLIKQARGGLALAAWRIGSTYVVDDRAKLASIEAALGAEVGK